MVFIFDKLLARFVELTPEIPRAKVPAYVTKEKKSVPSSKYTSPHPPLSLLTHPGSHAVPQKSH